MNLRGVAPPQSSGGMDPHVREGSSERLQQAAQEFESILMTHLLDSFQRSFSPGGKEEEEPGQNTLSGLASQAICEALSKGGGFGLASAFRGQIEKTLKVSDGKPMISVNSYLGDD